MGKVIGPGSSDHGKMDREHFTSNHFAKTIAGGGRREGRHLHETEHYHRGIKHEVGSHSAFPAHDGGYDAND